MFCTPWIAAPISSDSSASRLRSRQVSCITGSTPAWISAIATASGDACACADGLSVALNASTYAFIGASWRMISPWPPPSITGSSAVTTNSPASSLRSRFDIRDRRPPGRGLLVPAGDQVDPRRGALEAVVDRRAKVVDVVAPHRQLLRALVGPQPHTAHLGLNLAMAVCAHAAAWPVAQRLGARHRADKPG